MRKNTIVLSIVCVSLVKNGMLQNLTIRAEPKPLKRPWWWLNRSTWSFKIVTLWWLSRSSWSFKIVINYWWWLSRKLLKLQDCNLGDSWAEAPEASVVTEPKLLKSIIIYTNGVSRVVFCLLSTPSPNLVVWVGDEITRNTYGWAIMITLFTTYNKIKLSPRSLFLPTSRDLGHIDFRYQKISEESNESKIKHIRSIPVDSAYILLSASGVWGKTRADS